MQERYRSEAGEKELPHMKTITVADIARKAGVRPETARARMRRALAQEEGSLPEPVIEGHWIYNAKDRRKVERVISPHN